VKVSVIATVKNEGEAIRRLLDSLTAQTRPPDEVVFVDGGSTDDTVQVLESYADVLPLRVLVQPGCNISEGRNAAIVEARGEVIASTDAGVRLSPNWLEDLVRPFESQDDVQVVSGFFVADPHTAFETAMGATVLPALEDIAPERFLPSSRSVAFRKGAWERAGRYPPWLDYCEDLIFDLRLRDMYGPFPFAPEAVAYFRPRSDLGAFFVQYYRYARGDGKANLWPKRHAFRYFVYLFTAPALLILGLWRERLWLSLLVLGFAAHLWRPYGRLRTMMASLSPVERIKAVLWVPVIRITGDVAKMIGYPVGWFWRLKHLAKVEDRRWRK
jgi:glycosyltransferase involved in cell wall biosynthesis